MSTGSSRSDFDFGMSGTAALPVEGQGEHLSAAEQAMQQAKVKRTRPQRSSKPPVSQAPDPDLLVDDRTKRRRKQAIAGGILAVVSLMSLFVDAGYSKLFNPAEVFSCYGVWFGQVIGSVTGGDVPTANQILADHPEYFRIINRVPITLMTALCGAVLAVAGTLYQSAFRNPIASPSMLGVSSAIQLGDAILVLLFGTAAGTMLGQRYLVCYLCVVVVMLLLFTFGRLMSGRGRPFNVVNLLLIATILNQLIGVVVTYITYFTFTDEMWDVYNNLSEALSVNLSLLSWGVLLVTVAVALAPVVALRFRLNGLNFSDEDMRMAGINAQALRIIALISGTILLMAAQVQMGTVAMLALVVPHISRMMFSAEFRKQFAGNVLIGAGLLVLCRVIVGFVPVVGNIIPVSVVLNFLVLPFFVWMLAVQQRGWEQ